MSKRLAVDVVASGPGWRLQRVETCRVPLLGAVITPSGRTQTRVVESGAVMIGAQGEAAVYGSGHRIIVPGDASFVFLGSNSVEWVLAVAPHGAPTAPKIAHAEPRWAPVPLPLCEPSDDQWPEQLRPWSRLPRDVATWAGALGIHATSLAQRCGRLAGTSPKQILAGCRATLAWELGPAFEGRGAELALAAGYSSQSHLSSDLSRRFGRASSQLVTGDGAKRELEWLRLLRVALR
jgi:AraC-like DNA-binding protein